MENEHLEYPHTKCDDCIEYHHGIPVADPYRWLEDDASPDTARWIEEQNILTRNYMEHIPFRDKVHERLMQLWDFQKHGIPQREGDWFYVARNDGLQNQAVIYRRRVEGGDEELFLDPNLLSPDGTAALNGIFFSDDGKYCAYSISRSGSDWAEIRIINTETLELLPEHIRWIKFSMPSWAADSSGFYYSAYDAPDPEHEYSGKNSAQKVFFHRIGTDQSEDSLIYDDNYHPLRYFNGFESADGKYCFVDISEGTHGTEIIYKKTEDSRQEFSLLFAGFDHDYRIIYAEGDTAYVFTNYMAPNFRLVAVDLSAPETPLRDIIAEDPAMPLEEVTAVGGYFMASFLRNASSNVLQYDMDGKFIRRVEMGGICAAAGFKGKQNDQSTFYSVATYTAPPAVFRYDLTDGTSELVASSTVNFDPDKFITEQLFFESRDGTAVPLFMVSRKDIVPDGTNPVLMYGYGGFNISHLPVFNPSVILFLEQGGIFVDVTLRGGGEYGERWHRAGMLGNKQNVFDDFIAAAEYLVREKYTLPAKIAIMGGSNGGLLIGACMTQRPDLFAVAIPQVGVLDMLRYHLFTIGWGWVVEYGDPDDETQFEWLYRYSPLHNVRDGECYPATLVTTAEHDDRVVPAHSLKFAAALQKAQGCSRPILIRIDSDAGHGAGKPTRKRIDEATDIYSFIFQNCGISPLL